jgi:hypothetical protein
MTQQLSPAAQAVLTAVTLTKYDVPPEGLPAFAEEMAPLLAAALRAAADQVVPDKPAPDVASLKEFERWDAKRFVRLQFLAIATELEAQ